MKTESEYPFTAQQFHALTEEERLAVLAVAEYLTSSTIDYSDEDLSNALSLMKKTRGCVPSEEAGDDLLASVRRKFGAVYQVAIELAETELKRRGFKARKDFNFCLVIEPSCEDTTHVVIVDYDQPICYLHQWKKPWHLGFGSLVELAGAVLSARVALVNKVEELNKPREIFVCLEGGTVHEIVNLPENLRVTTLDYDIEDVEKERVEKSPVDGQLCVINKW
jgi:hypothetical protein